MQIELPPDLAQRLSERTASATGLSEVDVIRLGLEALDWQDAERQAIAGGIEAMQEGRVQNFHDFDCEFRKRNDIAPRA